MLLLIIFSLSVCSLLELSIVPSVIFTAVFSIGGFFAIIYCKLRFPLDEEEEMAIRSYILRANNIKKHLGSRRHAPACRNRIISE